MEVQVVEINYHGHIITTDWVRERIRDAIANRESFHVSNDNLGGDPFPRIQKWLTITWKLYPFGPLLRDSAGEGSKIPFNDYVSKIIYGGKELKDVPDVYAKLNEARRRHKEASQSIWNRGSNERMGRIQLDDWSLGGDPAPGVWPKDVNVYYRRGEGHAVPACNYLKQGDWYPEKEEAEEWSN